MKLGFAILWLVALLAAAESVTVAWRANSETNLVGYRVYAGTNSRAYHICIPTGLVTNQIMVLPESGRWFFAVTATNNVGRESAYSAEVVLEFPPAPPVVHGEAWVRVAAVIERSTNAVGWLTVTGAPTWFPATNGQEFFTTRQLIIEVQAAPATMDRVEAQ